MKKKIRFKYILAWRLEKETLNSRSSLAYDWKNTGNFLNYEIEPYEEAYDGMYKVWRRPWRWQKSTNSIRAGRTVNIISRESSGKANTVIDTRKIVIGKKQ